MLKKKKKAASGGICHSSGRQRPAVLVMLDLSNRSKVTRTILITVEYFHNSFAFVSVLQGSFWVLNVADPQEPISPALVIVSPDIPAISFKGCRFIHIPSTHQTSAPQS